MIRDLFNLAIGIVGLVLVGAVVFAWMAVRWAVGKRNTVGGRN